MHEDATANRSLLKKKSWAKGIYRTCVIFAESSRSVYDFLFKWRKDALEMWCYWRSINTLEWRVTENVCCRKIVKKMSSLPIHRSSTWDVQEIDNISNGKLGSIRASYGISSSSANSHLWRINILCIKCRIDRMMTKR